MNNLQIANVLDNQIYCLTMMIRIKGITMRHDESKNKNIEYCLEDEYFHYILKAHFIDQCMKHCNIFQKKPRSINYFFSSQCDLW